jgi:membrane protease YdiL (CAAX protease family)
MVEPTPQLADASTDVAAVVAEPPSTPQPFPGFWQGIGLILLLQVCSVPAFAVGAGVSALLQAFGVSPGASFESLVKPMIRALPYLPVLWLGARWAGKPWRETYPLKPVRLVWLTMFILALAGLAAVVAAVVSVVEWRLPAPSFLEKLIIHAGPFAVIFLAPMTEEPLCRGLILGGMLKRYSRPKAIVLSALVFGIAHLNPWQFVSAFLLGLFLGWVVAETGSLLLAILGHALLNATFFLLGGRVPEPPHMTVGKVLLLVALGLPLLGTGVMMLRASFRRRTV